MGHIEISSILAKVKNWVKLTNSIWGLSNCLTRTIFASKETSLDSILIILKRQRLEKVSNLSEPMMTLQWLWEFLTYMILQILIGHWNSLCMLAIGTKLQLSKTLVHRNPLCKINLRLTWYNSNLILSSSNSSIHSLLNRWSSRPNIGKTINLIGLPELRPSNLK